MLRGAARVFLRRGIHTTSPVGSAAWPLRHRFAMAAGASVIAASYLGWRINLESKGIALDSNSTRMTGFSLLCLIPLTGGASIAAPKPKTRASPTQSSDAPSAPSPDAADENGDDGLPSEEDGEASSQAAFDPVTGKINWDC